MADLWKINGLDELLSDFKKLPFLRQAQIIRNVNRRAVKKEVIPKLKNAIPHRSKKVRRRTKSNPFKIVDQKQVIAVSVKGKKTAIAAGISTKYFFYRFIEFGTKKRTTKKGAMNRGTMRARPFAEQALDNSINPMIRYLKTEYSKLFHRYLKK